ncbi:MAG: homoserine dehydrogenase [Thermoplasmatota archaeon]
MTAGTKRIALVGYGAVGKAFHELLAHEASNLATRYGIRPAIVGITRSRGAWIDDDGLPPGGTLLNKRKTFAFDAFLDAAKPDVLVEVTPTNLRTGEPGVGFIRQALARGIPVVTANKGPLVVAYRELTELAAKRGVGFRFEGTVAGAIPTLNLHDHCLNGNRVLRVDGILNGTSNFILSRMTEDGLEFDPALREAQELGYAEADPSADVEGSDAAAKLVILANHVLGRPLALADVRTQGIRSVTASAIRLAAAQGYVLRLIATVGLAGEASVAPRLVPRASPLNVSGALNVVRYTTEHAGAFTLIGKGAGGKETATAVLSDVLSILRA